MKEWFLVKVGTQNVETTKGFRGVLGTLLNVCDGAFLQN